MPSLVFSFLGTVTLDAFFQKNGESSPSVSVVENYKKLKDVAVKTLFNELDEVEYLGDGSGLRVAAYLRVSTQRQAKKGVSLMAQKEEMRNVARKIGAGTIYWFIDAKSGVSFVERKLNAIYRLAEMGLIDKVVCREIDRMGREAFQLLAFIISVRSLGVTTAVPSGELDVRRCEDIIKASIKVVMAEEENVKRTKSALSSKILNFKRRKWNMPVPLGYRKTANGWIEKLPEFEPVLKDIFKLFLALKSYSKVADHINNKYSGLIGRRLTRDVVARLLTNPVYIGKPRCGRERTQVILSDAEIEVEDLSLAFIDMEIFGKVQEIIAKKKMEYHREKKPFDELREILREDVFEVFDNLAFLCAVCQMPMVKNGQSYICPQCRKQRRLIKKSEMEKLAEWIIKREKVLDLFQKLLNENGNVNDIAEKLHKHDINMNI